MSDEPGVGSRVYHRRADLFGTIEDFEGEGAERRALVRYEYPHDGKSFREVQPSELVHASEAPSGE